MDSPRKRVQAQKLARVSGHGNRIRLEFGSKSNHTFRRFSIAENPTKSVINRYEKHWKAINARWRDGEDLDALIAALKGEEAVQPNTLDYYARHYLQVVAPDSVVYSTLKDYMSIYNGHWRLFGYRRIDQVQISEYKSYLASTGLSKKRRRNILSVLRLIYDEAVQDGVFPVNPLDNWTIKKDKEAEQYEADPYEMDERDKILDWLYNNEKSLIAWRYFFHGFYSGMRTGELLGFPWDNYKAPFAEVKQEMVRRAIRQYDKTDARRTQPYPKPLQEMLTNNPTRFSQGLVHLTPTGKMFKDADWLMDWWKRAHEATEVRRREKPYPWRSTFISMCLSNGVEVQDVATWVGNSPEMIRKHYLRYIPKDQRVDELIDKMGEALS